MDDGGAPVAAAQVISIAEKYKPTTCARCGETIDLGWPRWFVGSETLCWDCPYQMVALSAASPAQGGLMAGSGFLLEFLAIYEQYGKLNHRAPLTDALRMIVLRKYGFRCAHCGSAKDLTIDHIIPRSKGGSDRPSNLQVLCGPCNRKKGTSIEATA